MRKDGGFTLVELLVTLLILTILYAVTSTAISSAQRSAKYTSTNDTLRQVSTAWSLYLLDNRQFPDEASFASGLAPVSIPGGYFPMNKRNIEILNGGDTTYIELSHRDHSGGESVVDAWNQTVFFTLDFNCDGLIDSPSPPITKNADKVKGSALSLSFGDKKFKYRSSKWTAVWQ